MITKTFTAAGVGLLADERKLDFRQPVREILPGFRLHDRATTDRVTVQDLLCHQTGLPRHDWIHMPGDLSRQQMLDTLRHLEPNRDLRETWQYQNLGYVVAGAIIERISGCCWEDFTTERLLLPLGCTDFGFSIEALAAVPNHAKPHAMNHDKAVPTPLWPIHATPAGGLNASVSDLAKWMRLLLQRGQVGHVGAKRLLPEAVLAQMMTPRVHASTSEFAEIGDIHYGLGFFLDHYRGERTVSHSGSWLGWGTLMTLLPARSISISITVLMNRAPSAVTALLTYAVLDRLCGQAPIDWFGRFAHRRQALLKQQATAEQAHQDVRRPGTQPSHALAEYAGDYAHPAYGCMTIALDGTTLSWRWRGISGPLEHRHYDVFTLP